MLPSLFFLSFIVILQRNVLGVLLGCHHCPELRVYSFIITADTVPSNIIDKCSFRMSQRSCSIDLQIDLDKRQTLVNITSSTNYMQTSINVGVGIQSELKYTRQISFWCSDPKGGCNTGDYLKRVLRSLTIAGSFNEFEFLLIPNNQTITKNSCIFFSNLTTAECPDALPEDGKACFIQSTTNAESSSEVCARYSPIDDYYLIHAMNFFIDNLTVNQSDDRALSCAVPECNALVNLEGIRQAVSIDFDSSTFFASSTTTAIVTTTTTSNASSSLLWKNTFRKLFLFLMAFVLNTFMTIQFS